MNSASISRRACAAAVAATALGLGAAADAGATDYAFQSFRGVKCTLRTTHTAFGPKSDKTLTHSARFWCNRPLVRISETSNLQRTTPTPAYISSVAAECDDSRTCGTTVVPTASGTVYHQSAGVFVHETNFYAQLNGAKGIMDPQDPRNDWWIAADLRAQCYPGPWGLKVNCMLREPLVAAP